MGTSTMFGKTYNTVGSSDSNLLLKSKGDIKIQWGGKYIDLIKDGKIAGLSNLAIKIISSESDISGDGIFIIKTESGNQIWVSYKGETINTSSSGDGISYTGAQSLTGVQKQLALLNIGLIYSSYQEAVNASPSDGIIFILDTNKLYTVSQGNIVEFSLASSIDSTSEELSYNLGNFTFSNSTMTCSGNFSLVTDSGQLLYFYDNILTIGYDTIVETLQSSNFVTTKSGYQLTTNNNISTLEVDNIIVRKSFNLSYLAERSVTYDELVRLIDTEQLVVGVIYNMDVVEDLDYLCLIADSPTTFNKVYYHDNPQWIIDYDLESNTIIQLTDEYNNTANFDFKHITFNDKYLFNGPDNTDRSLTGTIKNCNIVIDSGNCIFENTAENVSIKHTNGNVIFNLEVINTKASSLMNCTFESVLNSNLGIIENLTFTNIVNADFYNAILGEVTITNNDKLALGTVEHKEIYVLGTEIRIKSFYNVIPSGLIMMWNGTTENIPEGWLICDGENGTPNLTDKFIKAGTTVGDNTVDSNIDDNNLLTLTADHLPSHSHSHSHTATLDTIDVSLSTIEDLTITSTTKTSEDLTSSEYIEVLTQSDKRLSDSTADVQTVATGSAYIVKSSETIEGVMYYYCQVGDSVEITMDSGTTPTFEGLTINGNIISGITEAKEYSGTVTYKDKNTDVKIVATATNKHLHTITIPEHSHDVTISGHTHTAEVSNTSIGVSDNNDNDLTWSNAAIKIEPHAYSLIFIMKS